MMQTPEGDVLKQKNVSADRRKATGSHYTPKNLAAFVAQHIVSVATTQLSSGSLTVADPAVGDGELLTALLRALPRQILPNTTVHGFETDTLALDEAQRRLS